MYDKKRGNREKLSFKWGKLKDTEREAIISYLPQYKKATPDKQFRKDPETFLNNRSWEDEIPIRQIKPKEYNSGLPVN